MTCETHRVPGNGRTIVFLSDFGYRNEWVGICHAVMDRIAPESPVVDLSHGVPPLDVRNGALLLVDSLPYLAADAILLAMVGLERRARPRPRDRGRRRPARGRPRQRPVRSGSVALGGVARAVEIHLARRGADADVALVSRPRRARARCRAPRGRHCARHARAGGEDPATLAQMTIPRADDRARKDRVRGARPQPLRQCPVQRP